MSANAPLGAAMIHSALLILMGVLLAFLVIRQRREAGIGDGGSKTLAKAIRVHANFTEYAPFAIASYILLALAGVSASFIHAIGAIFLVGRVAHATGLMKHEGPSVGRLMGTVASSLVLIVAAVRLLVGALG